MVNEKTKSDFEVILEVNKKAIEINIEVEKQNEQVIECLDDVKIVYDRIEEKIDDVLNSQKEQKRITEESKLLIEKSKELVEEVQRIAEESNDILKDTVKKKVEEVEKNLFRLIIILGSAGIGTLVTIVQSFLHK